MERDRHKRPDYDYYEDSLGDPYSDYDEPESGREPDDQALFTDGYDTDTDETNNYSETDRINSSDINDAEESFPGIADTDNNDPKQYKYNREMLISLMDKYHNGSEADKKEVCNEFCIMLTPMIKRMVRTSRGVDSEYIDYIQHCYLYICKRLDRFDPNLSFPFQYFKFIIREAITDCHESSYGKSSHEMNIDRKVRKQIREYTAKDISPSPSRIASETGLTVRQVEDSLFRIQAEKPVLGEDMTMFERDDGSNMPLDSVLKNEVSEVLKNAINCLPADERDVILLSYNFYELDEEFSNKKIAETLHISEIKVKELLISAKRHLKRDFSLDQLLGKSKRISQREYSPYLTDPARYSFNPDSDDYRFLDEDEDEPPVKTKDKRNVVYLDRISDISFDTY